MPSHQQQDKGLAHTNPSNQIILVSGLKIVAKSQSDLWRLITNSSVKFKADPISGVCAKGYHRIGTNSADSAEDDH